MTASWFLRACFAILLAATAVFSVRPMITYRALELGAGATEIGILAGSYAVLSFLLAIPTGRWVDRLGETWFVVAGATVMATTCFWLFTAERLVVLGVAQALLGAGHLLGLVAAQALLANCGPPEERDARYGIFAVVASVGQVIGPTLGGFVASAAGGSSRHVFLVSGLLLLIAVGNGLSLERWPPPDEECVSRSPAPLTAPFRAIADVIRIRSMPQAMLASVTVLVTIDLLVAYLPAYGEAYAIPVATVGLLLSVRAGASALSRLVMVLLINLLGWRRVFALGLALPAGALLLMPLLPQIAALYVLMAVAGFGLGLGQPLSVSWVAGAAPPESRGMALGVRLTGNRLGQMMIPAAVGAVAGATSVVVIFVVLALMLAGSSGIVWAADFEEGAR